MAFGKSHLLSGRKCELKWGYVINPTSPGGEGDMAGLTSSVNKINHTGQSNHKFPTGQPSQAYSFLSNVRLYLQQALSTILTHLKKHAFEISKYFSFLDLSKAQPQAHEHKTTNPLFFACCPHLTPLCAINVNYCSVLTNVKEVCVSLLAFYPIPEVSSLCFLLPPIFSPLPMILCNPPYCSSSYSNVYNKLQTAVFQSIFSIP